MDSSISSCMLRQGSQKSNYTGCYSFISVFCTVQYAELCSMPLCRIPHHRSRIVVCRTYLYRTVVTLTRLSSDIAAPLLPASRCSAVCPSSRRTNERGFQSLRAKFLPCRRTPHTPEAAAPSLFVPLPVIHLRIHLGADRPAGRVDVQWSEASQVDLK